MAVGSLADRLAQGDEGAWEELYREYRRGVIALCMSFLHSREDALDAAEEAFLKAFRNSKTVIANGNVRAWLFTIAANTCKDLLRKRQRGQVWLKKWLPGKESTFQEPSVAETVEQQERHDAMRKAIAQLEETYRVPLVLRYYEDMDYDQIADMLSQIEGAPVQRGTVASRLNRAKQQLKEIMEGGPS